MMTTMVKRSFWQILESSRIPVTSAIGRFSTCILGPCVAVGHSILELIWDLLVSSNDATSYNGASSRTSRSISWVRSKPRGWGKGQEGGDTEEHLKPMLLQRLQQTKMHLKALVTFVAQDLPSYWTELWSTDAVLTLSPPFIQSRVWPKMQLHPLSWWPTAPGLGAVAWTFFHEISSSHISSVCLKYHHT